MRSHPRYSAKRASPIEVYIIDNNAEVFLAAYELGLALAIRETQLGESIFPEECPYTPEQVMNPEFLPESNQADA